jgi:hypothetical protein
MRKIFASLLFMQAVPFRALKAHSIVIPAAATQSAFANCADRAGTDHLIAVHAGNSTVAADHVIGVF